MTDDLQRALGELRDAVDAVRLPLRLPDVAERQQQARAMVHQLDDYVLPRLATIDAPLLCVVGGSTGAGKSTLVNSLVGRTVTVSGVIRPTTKAPVLVHHPDDGRWFADDRILPGLARTTGQLGGVEGTRALRLVAEDTIPPGLAILDAPDVDSVDARNRELAAQLLAAADLWLFVTSAARYADAVPWEYLRSAAERSAAVGVVLDRVDPTNLQEIGTHLGQMMSQRGLGDSPLFGVPETTATEGGVLPAQAVQPIKSWLASLAADQASRSEVVHRTLDGAITQLVQQSPVLARAVDEQVHTLAQLRGEADASYAEAVRTIGVQTADGTLLRGEVLTRWHQFVGTGEFFRALEQRIGWLRDKIVATVQGKPPAAAKVQVAVEAGLEALVREEGNAAAERAEAAWHAHPSGRALLASGRYDLSRASADFPADVARSIRDWQGDVLDLVADEGMGKRSRARFLAFGVNVIGVALMIVVFSQTGGLLGAEVGVAGGTALLAQRVLEAVFGDQAIRSLTQRAKADLDGRVEALLAAELRRFHALLDRHAADPADASRLRAAITEVGRLKGLPVHVGSVLVPSEAEDARSRELAGRGRPELTVDGPEPAAEVIDTGGSSTQPPEAEVVDAEVVEPASGSGGSGVAAEGHGGTDTARPGGSR
ncbi:ABC transporter [Microlunatus sp. Y2014]|uniref:ABC transporter n=1 Tax=Microlunatus sp. Y2014 TaxID=3418488 RepID=UPI003DA728A2